jgi:hypothetical protein
LLDRLASNLQIRFLAHYSGLAEYILNSDVWSETSDDGTPILTQEELSNLDNAILATVENLSCPTEELADALDTALRGSLWKRRLLRRDERSQNLQQAIFLGRARWIWQHSDPIQRKGFFSAGLGFLGGKFIDDNLDFLLENLVAAEQQMNTNEIALGIQNIITVAELVMNIHPFIYRNRPNRWKEILGAWLNGIPLGEIHELDGGDEIKFIQDGVVYQLVWAVEAIRVQALAKGDSRAEQLNGNIPLLLTYGVPSRQAAILLESGLPSREMALNILRSFPASFISSEEVGAWLAGINTSLENIWSNDEENRIWFDFVRSWTTSRRSNWANHIFSINAIWTSGREAPPPGTYVQLVNTVEYGVTHICTPELEIIGKLMQPVVLTGHVLSRVSDAQTSIFIQRFGPVF